MFKIKVVEKIKTHVLCSVTFSPPKILPFVRCVEKYGGATEDGDDMALRLHTG
jgi:hypothetical protein